MNSPTLGLRVAGALFAVFCIVHLVRVIGSWSLTIGGHYVPIWTSVVVAIAGAALATWMWWLATPHTKPPGHA